MEAHRKYTSLPGGAGGSGDLCPRATEPIGPVLFVAPEPFFEDRGTPIAIRQVLRALTERGVEVDLLTYPIGRAIDLPGLTIHRAPNPFRIRHVPIGFSIRKVVLDLLMAREFVRLLRHREYRVVHAVEESAFLAALLAAPRGIRMIYDMHSSLPEHMGVRRVFRNRLAQGALHLAERWLLRRTDFVFCSAGLGRIVRDVAPGKKYREWWFPGQRREPDSEGARTTRAELGIPETAPVVLYCGTFARYQNIPLLVDTVPYLRARIPDAVVLLVGDGADRVALESKMPEGMIRLRRQPRERLPMFLDLADVVVSPRISGNNLPLKIFDYMAAGKPIVAADGETHRSLLDERTALFTPPTPCAFAAGIATLLRDKALAARLGAAGREFAEEHLDWYAFSERILEAYRAAVGGTDR